MFTTCSRRVLCVIGTLMVSTDVIGAQYFGRNKVQYEHFDFRILPTPHFELYFYPAESTATAAAARMSERWYVRHQALLNHEFSGNPLIFYADAPDFQQSNVIEGELSQGTGGVTEGLRERVIMPFTGSYAETDHVLGHELVHVFQYRIAAASKSGLRSIGNIPLWLIEGMAEYLSLGRTDSHTAMWMRDAVRRNDLPTLDQLTNDARYFPYRYGQALWAYIGGRFGDRAVNDVFRESLVGGWKQGIQTALGISADSLGRAWHEAMRSAYGPVLAGRSAPDATGRAVTINEGRGQQNISPAVSPDGRYVAYFSSRGLFGIDLYLADAGTGEVITQLTSVTSDRHFDALSFISSAGTWSPDGSQLAFVVYAGGNNELNVMDVASRDIVRRIQVRGVGAMTDPAWSPDGNSIAFTGLRGGISDLYLHDLQRNETRQLTNDAEAQFHAAWSPDGRQLAFATDAGAETDMRLLRTGPMRLALVDVASGRVQLLPRIGEGKQINPQFTVQGDALLFVSDRDGVSDIYRMQLSNGALRRVTHTASGITGITSLSPALSVARRTGAVFFSVFDDQGYNIRSLSADESMGDVVSGAADRVAAVLPPAVPQRGEFLVDPALDRPAVGLPAALPTNTTPYSSSLALDYVGGPQIGVSAGGGYGTGLAGAIGLSFSDQLGNRILQGAVQAQGELQDVGGQFLYLNRERRWSWGFQGYHIPITGGFASASPATFDVNGQQVSGTIYRQEIQRVFFDNLQLVAQYPLSSTRRFEFGAGGQRVGFSRRVDSLYAVGNQVLRETRDGVPAIPALTFATASAAYVGDYSFSGFTSPIAGGRYRFEVAPNIGSLNYVSALADYRRYLFARPVTMAFRALHFGRYGADAESDRQQALFVGQPYLIRGYDPSGFSLQECTGGATADDCPQFNRLSGSRLAVVNAELRVPLFGTSQYGLIPFSFLPTDVAPFVDAGLAWSSGDDVQLRFDRDTPDRVPVFSAGVSVRANLLGFAIGEFYWARPFQRPGKSWVFGFQLQPGW